MARSDFAYIWKYAIKPERRSEFIAAYGPRGDWVRLFSEDPAYIGTELLQNASNANEFLTIDHWTSLAARDAFRQNFAAEFEALDAKCEAYTISEVFVGDFQGCHSPA